MIKIITDMDEMQYDMLTLKSICAEKVRVFNIVPLCADLKSTTYELLSSVCTEISNRPLWPVITPNMLCNTRSLVLLSSQCGWFPLLLQSPSALSFPAPSYPCCVFSCTDVTHCGLCLSVSRWLHNALQIHPFCYIIYFYLLLIVSSKSFCITI